MEKENKQKIWEISNTMSFCSLSSYKTLEKKKKAYICLLHYIACTLELSTKFWGQCSGFGSCGMVFNLGSNFKTHLTPCVPLLVITSGAI